MLRFNAMESHSPDSSLLADPKRPMSLAYYAESLFDKRKAGFLTDRGSRLRHRRVQKRENGLCETLERRGSELDKR